jgi:hypothetical protein
MIEKLNKVIDILKDLESEERVKVENIKKDILSKLNNEDDTYYLILVNFESDTDNMIKIYSTDAENRFNAYESFNELSSEDEAVITIMLSRDELKSLMFKIMNNDITRLDKEDIEDLDLNDGDNDNA